MSQWTHVNAAIRFDALLGRGLPLPDEIERALPAGSEGALEYQVWLNPNTNHLAAMTVHWWGDLRDHDDAGQILDYFKGLTGGTRMIRSGILEIEVEFKHRLVYRFDNDKEEPGWDLINIVDLRTEPI